MALGLRASSSSRTVYERRYSRQLLEFVMEYFRCLDAILGLEVLGPRLEI